MIISMNGRDRRKLRTLLSKAKKAIAEAEELLGSRDSFSDGKPKPASKALQLQRDELQRVWREIQADMSSHSSPKDVAERLLRWKKPDLIALVVANELPVDTRAAKLEIVNQLLQIVRVTDAIGGKLSNQHK